MRFVPPYLLGKLQLLLSCEEGQDLVEYALIIALISLASVAGMDALAGDINNAFTSVGSAITSSI